MTRRTVAFVAPDDLRVLSAAEVAATLGGIAVDSVYRLWDAGSLAFVTLTEGEKRPRRGTLVADLRAFIDERTRRGAVQREASQSALLRPPRSRSSIVVPMTAKRRRNAA